MQPQVQSDVESVESVDLDSVDSAHVPILNKEAPQRGSGHPRDALHESRGGVSQREGSLSRAAYWRPKGSIAPRLRRTDETETYIRICTCISVLCVSFSFFYMFFMYVMYVRLDLLFISI